MRIERIRLRNFRNYKDLDLWIDSKRNVFIGENAHGKTNLIEAIYICAFSKSFRTQNAADLVMIGEDEGSVIIDAIRDEIDRKISITINKAGKKMIKIDNKVIRRTAELLNNLVVVIFSPEDMRIIKDNPEKRRVFLNKEISQIKPAYYEKLKNYNDVLKQRNALLRERKLTGKEDILDILDIQLSNYGEDIIRYRKNFTEILSEKSSAIQKNISGGKEELEIVYKSTTEGDSVYNKLKENIEKDIYSGFTGVGPHRDDIDFYVNGRNAKKYGSQGQQRTIALSMKLAELEIAKEEIGEEPILLLDDVLSELDHERQKYLLNEIQDVQIFVTAAETGDIMSQKIKDGIIYNVEEGKITKR
jgi:DNA replication and repair protein RecF